MRLCSNISSMASNIYTNMYRKKKKIDQDFKK